MGLFASATGGADAVIKVGLEGSEAIKGADELEGNLGTRFGNMASSALGIGIAFGTIAAAGVASFAAIGKSMAEAGEKLGSIEAAFNNLGGNNEIISQASERILGLASNTDLLATANKAMIMGLPDVNKNFADIVDLGGRMANALGTDVVGSVEQLTQALATGQERQLAQFGLFMDTAAAAKQYAEANNIVGRSLTESEKVMAKQAFALEQVKARLTEIPPISASVTNALTATNVQFTNMYDEAGKIINSNPELIAGIEAFKTSMAGIDITMFATLAGDALGFAARLAADLIPWATSFVQVMQSMVEFGIALRSSLESALVVGVEGFKALAGEAKVAWLALVPGARAATDAIGLTTTQTERFQRTLTAMSQTVMPRWSRSVEKAAKEGLAFKASVIDLGTESTKTGEGLKRNLNPALVDNKEETKKAAKETTGLVNIYKELRDRLANNQITKFVGEMSDKFKEGAISLEQMSKEFEIFRKGLPEIGIDMKAFDAQLGSINLGLEKTRDTIKETDQQFGNLGGFEKLQAQIGEGIGSGFDFSGITGGDVFSGITPLAGQLADKFINETTTGIGAAVGAVIGGAIAAIFSLGIGTAGGAAIGAIVGDAAEGLAMNMNLFGGSKQHETVARRNVHAYFDEVFRETDFYLRGESGRFTRFEDFDLGPRQLFEFKPGLGAHFLEQIQQYPDAIHNVFRGVGGAVASMFEEDFIGGTQVGTAMMVAFGGDIDALKLVVLELDLTFEQFGESMVDAFFAGNISALEYNSIMRDAAEVFAEGLAGIGVWGDAFQNFIDSAGKGRLAIKSLRDMAVEFIQDGGTSLAGFRAALESSGRFTSEQIEQLFAGMEGRGITSLEELRTASDETLIGLTGDLQAVGFAFGETFESAAAEMEHLREQMEQIPSEINSRVNIEVAAKFRNDDDRRAFEYITQGGPGIESSP